MKPDPIDQLGARLFEVARSEAISPAAVQRTLAAARREASQKQPVEARFSASHAWLAAAACVALAAGAALLLRPKPNSLGISAEPTVTVRSSPEHRTAASSETRQKTTPAAPSLPSAAKLPASAGPTTAHSAPATLSDELSALKVASSALSAGDPQAALAALDRYDRVLKGQKLRAEATLLRIEALSRAGQAEAASALAQRFVEQNPGNPLVDRARSFVHE